MEEVKPPTVPDTDAAAAAASAAAAAAARTQQSPEPSQLETALGQLPPAARQLIEARMVEIERAKQEQQKIANEATAKLANGSAGDKVYLEQQLALLLDHLGAVGPRFNVAGIDKCLDGPGAASAVSRLVAACNTKFMNLDSAEAAARPNKRARNTEPEPETVSPEPVAAAAPRTAAGGAATSGNALLRQALAAQYQ
ncbi:MAG: hypothetical protein CL678_15680 [Bdellovibrionaceae bacterium]|nr:hypothetical protein [Pseudobdellovibrionaceae bacterium]